MVKSTRELEEEIRRLKKFGCIPWDEPTPSGELRMFGEWTCCRQVVGDHDEFFVVIGYPCSDPDGYIPCALSITENAWQSICEAK